MQPLQAENLVGAIMVALSGWYLGSHMHLTRQGTALVHLVSGAIALGILAAPYLR